jgi:hypothetical protein
MTAFASVFGLPGDVWHDVVEHQRQYLLMVFVGFILSFGFIRLSTRLIRSQRFAWWPGNIERGGVHVHHMVFGIATMTIAGVVSFSLSNTGLAYTLSAFFFGVGLGLTLDEFALWFYVRDVYWENEGRVSVDPVMLSAAMMGIALVFTRLRLPGLAGAAIRAADRGRHRGLERVAAPAGVERLVLRAAGALGAGLGALLCGGWWRRLRSGMGGAVTARAADGFGQLHRVLVLTTTLPSQGFSLGC